MSETEKVIPFVPPKREVPALGMSVVTNMPGDRQITLQYFVPGDASPKEKNAAMDEMWAVVDRQKAKYEIEGLEKDLERSEKTIAFMNEDVARVEEDHEHKVAALKKKIELSAAEEETANQAGYEAWTKSGRRGSYAPQGTRKSTIDACQRAAKAYREELDRIIAERAANIANVEATSKRHREENGKIRIEIAQRKRLLEG